jgi:hypothetical protein
LLLRLGSAAVSLTLAGGTTVGEGRAGLSVGGRSDYGHFDLAD